MTPPHTQNHLGPNLVLGADMSTSVTESIAPPPTPAAAPSTSGSGDGWIGAAQATRGFAELDREALKGSILEATDKLIDKHGGPVQYLKARYAKEADRQEYARKLLAEFPAGDLHQWHPFPSGPATDRASAPAFIVHLSKLGFDAENTLSLLPTGKVSRQLMDEILADGFISAGDPLILRADIDMGKKDFSFTFIKGLARISTLHVLVTLCFDDGVDIKVMHSQTNNTYKRPIKQLVHH